MELGNFSMSLSVKDLQASIDFYTTLGFKQSGGDINHNYIVMRNGTTVIGLYQGMIEQNMLTFNPKWDIDKNQTSGADIRDIHSQVKDAGIIVEDLHNKTEQGPDYFYLTDPDGNVILFDQHV